MIELHLKRKTTSLVDNIVALVKPNKHGGVWVESQRRDAIIKHLAQECKYKVGDVVLPADKTARKKYGEAINVERIMDSYVQYGRSEPWPDGDNPMIVCAFSVQENTRFLCTTNYLIPFNSDGSSPT